MRPIVTVPPRKTPRPSIRPRQRSRRATPRASEASPGHGNDKSQLGNADPGNNGLGHQPHELPNQAAAHAAADIPPVAAGEDANGGHAAHSHGAAARKLIDGRYPRDNDRGQRRPGVRGEPPGHGNDKSQSADANPGNNGLGHQPVNCPAKPRAPRPRTFRRSRQSRTPRETMRPHDHGAAAKDSQTIDTGVASVAHGNSRGSQGAAAGDTSDQFHFANANPGTSQSIELPSHAHSQLAAEIPVSTTDNSAGHA